MSSKTDENTVQSNSVDVNVGGDENVRNSNKSCDSGIETGDSSTATLSSLPSSELQLLDVGKQTVLSPNTDYLDNDTITTLSTSSTISPDVISATDDLLTLDEFVNNHNDSDLFKTSVNNKNEDLHSLDENLNSLLDTNAVESVTRSAVDPNLPTQGVKTENDNENKLEEASILDLSEESSTVSINKALPSTDDNTTETNVNNIQNYQETGKCNKIEIEDETTQQANLKINTKCTNNGEEGNERLGNFVEILAGNDNGLFDCENIVTINNTENNQPVQKTDYFDERESQNRPNNSLLNNFKNVLVEETSTNVFDNIKNKDMLRQGEIKIEEINTDFTEQLELENARKNPITNAKVDLNNSSSTNDLANEKTEIRDKTPFKISEQHLVNTNRNLTTSTTSLDDQNSISTHIISKSPFSRSAENISTTDNLNSSDKDLNKEKILNDFLNQKTKAGATQKVTTDVKTTPESQTNDSKYTRLPKEILHQDLGSLVKNVHGIFSSVSGSLKYAYNQTQKAPKSQLKTVTRPLPNSKLMDNIFEDSEKSFNIQTADKLDDSPIRASVHNSDMKKDDVQNSEDKEGEGDCKDDFKLHLESLERELSEQRRENSILRERVKSQVDELQQSDVKFKEIETKMDSMSKRLEQACREKDAAVMRYASVECTAIDAKKQADRAIAAEKAAVTEMELIATKLKSAAQEKQRICQLYDDKCHELATSERELLKVREDVKELEGRLKWTQSKLRMEMEAYKDSTERADRLSQQLTELEAAKEAAIANSTDAAKARQLEHELKQNQAALILCKHEKEDLERKLNNTTQQLDNCRRERDTAKNNYIDASKEVERLKESNLRLEEEAAELASLRAQAALADTLSAQLQRENERALQAEESLSLERARAETCARREAAALQHAASLTAKHVQQRASATGTLHKAQALEVDNQSLRERIASLEEEVARLQAALSEESEKRSKETRTLARKVAEITEEATEAAKKLEWEKGENEVLKKKHANAIKELNRELSRALKRCEQLEAKLPPPDSNRTGSISSLSSSESAPQIEENHSQTHNGHPDTIPDIQVREPDRQALIERIVSLQRAAARRSERCEFLEEHSKQLTKELRGKSKLLRQLLCSLPAGAVASSQSDAHKKEIARLGGGAMAAVWGGEVGGMTLELSLEMNNKLQAVLEDALLKNITLKENMDTLGDEIARLKGQMASKN